MRMIIKIKVELSGRGGGGGPDSHQVCWVGRVKVLVPRTYLAEDLYTFAEAMFT